MAFLKQKTVHMLAIAVLCIMVSGCMPMMRTGISIAHPALENIEASLFKQHNLDLAEKGLPGTIMLLEGMLETAPDDMLLQVMAVKAYAGLGMLVEDESPEEATALYMRGTEWGIAALKQHGGFRKALEQGKNMNEAVREIKSKTFVPALLWTAASMGSNVLLNVGDPMIAIDLGAVNAMASQAIIIDPRYFYGFAHMFIGTANSMLPAAFGGDKEKALRAFETISALNNGKFLLSKVFYARFYLTDDKLINQTLNGVVEAPDGLIPEIELMNQIAKAKAGHYLNQ